MAMSTASWEGFKSLVFWAIVLGGGYAAYQMDWSSAVAAGTLKTIAGIAVLGLGIYGAFAKRGK